MRDYLNLEGLSYFLGKLLGKFASKEEVVLVTEQTLTDVQQTTAQANIGLEEATESEIYALMLEEGAMPVVQAEDGSVLCVAENEMLLI